MTEQLPFISVVIPVRNEAPFIKQTVRYVQEQNYPADLMEILVVDGESDDGTRRLVEEIAASDQRVKLLDNPRRLSSAARNIGAKAARGEIITYIDGHTYIDNDRLLRNTARLMLEKKVEALSRPQFLDTPENNPFQQAVSLARKSPLGHGLDSTIYTTKDDYVNPTSSGASYRQSVFDDIGYFDEHFDACEDVEFNYRVARSGRKSFTSLDLAVYYYPRTTLGRLFHQMKRYGVGRMRLARKHPGTLSLGTLVPPLFVLGLIVGILLSIFIPPIGFAVGALYGLYAAIVLLTSLYIAAGSSLSHFVRLIVIFPTIHIGLGWGFLTELVRPRADKAPKVK